MPERVDFAEFSWIETEERLRRDTRVVLPLGATEEHGYLSLATDSLFIDRVTRAACQRMDILRAPVMPFGCSSFSIRSAKIPREGMASFLSLVRRGAFL